MYAKSFQFNFFDAKLAKVYIQLKNLNVAKF